MSARPLLTTSAIVGSRGLGLIRSLLALSTLLTLLNTPSEMLFFFSNPQQVEGGVCTTFQKLCFFDLLTPNYFPILKWTSVAILLAVIIGFNPRWTAPLHWWVSVSFTHAVALPDGGDQINAVLTMLLLPICLLDGRRSHWDEVPFEPLSTRRHVLSSFFWMLIKAQCHFIYLDAAIDKIKVAEWRNGTALFYWFQDPVVGAPDFLLSTWTTIFSLPWMLVFMTWGVMALELTLAMSWRLPERYQNRILLAGSIFHFGIILNHGLISFFFTMLAVLVTIAHRTGEDSRPLPANFSPRSAGSSKHSDELQTVGA